MMASAPSARPGPQPQPQPAARGDALLLRVHSPAAATASAAAGPAPNSANAAAAGVAAVQSGARHPANGSDSSGVSEGAVGGEVVEAQTESESVEAIAEGGGGDGDGGGNSARRKLLSAPQRNANTTAADCDSSDDDATGEDDTNGADADSGAPAGGDSSTPFPLARARSLHRRNKSSTGSQFGSLSSEFGLLEESVDTIRETLIAVLRFFTFQSTLEPNARFKVAWDWFLIGLALYNWFFVGWCIAIDPQLGATLYAVDWFVTCCFLLDILITFRTGYVDYSGNEIFDAKLIAVRFVSSLFIVDALAAFPFHIFSPLIHFGPSAQFVDNCLKVNFLLRASKLVNSERIDSFISPQARISKLLFGFLCLAHFFACLFFFVGSVQSGDDSWILRQGLQLKPHSEQYICALYWSANRSTGVRVLVLLVLVLVLVNAVSTVADFCRFLLHSLAVVNQVDRHNGDWSVHS